MKYTFVGEVPSQSNPNKKYTIKMNDQGVLTCNCPSWINNTRGRSLRTCKHTDLAIGFMEGKTLVGKKNSGYLQEKVTVVCVNYPDKCSECDVRFKCWTSREPEFDVEELKRSKVSS